MNTSLSTRTICCKVVLDSAADRILRETQQAFNRAATYCASVAWRENITNKNKLHHLVYGTTRVDYGLGAQLACCARDKAAEAVRRTRQDTNANCPTFRDDSSIRYDARTYRLMSLDRVSLNTRAGRVIGQLVLGNFQRRTLYDTTWKIGGAELIGKEHRFQKHVNHEISKRLVEKAKQQRKALALEDLKGIRTRGTVRRSERRQRASWAFHQLRVFVSYKAQRAGVRVVFVDPRNTSRTCSACGYGDTANRTTQDRFLCVACGSQSNADVNAAVNISRVAVNQPLVLHGNDTGERAQSRRL